MAKGKAWTALWVPNTDVCVCSGGEGGGQDTPGVNKVLQEFQSRLPWENGTRPARRNENSRGLSGVGVPRRALCSQHGAGGKSSWDLGSRGVLAHPHASCSGYSLSPASGTLSPRGRSAGRSRSCRTTLLTCPDQGRRRCGQPGKGLMSLAPGCRSGCSTSLPGSSWSKERVSSTAAGTPHSAEACSALTRWRMRRPNHRR